MASVLAISVFAMANGWDPIVKTRHVHKSVANNRVAASARKAFAIAQMATADDCVISVIILLAAAGDGLQRMPKA